MRPRMFSTLCRLKACSTRRRRRRWSGLSCASMLSENTRKMRGSNWRIPLKRVFPAFFASMTKVSSSFSTSLAAW